MIVSLCEHTLFSIEKTAIINRLYAIILPGLHKIYFAILPALRKIYSKTGGTCRPRSPRLNVSFICVYTLLLFQTEISGYFSTFLSTRSLRGALAGALAGAAAGSEPSIVKTSLKNTSVSNSYVSAFMTTAKNLYFFPVTSSP